VQGFLNDVNHFLFSPMGGGFNQNRQHLANYDRLQTSSLLRGTDDRAMLAENVGMSFSNRSTTKEFCFSIASEVVARQRPEILFLMIKMDEDLSRFQTIQIQVIMAIQYNLTFLQLPLVALQQVHKDPDSQQAGHPISSTQ
jgi:hypothetical protein